MEELEALPPPLEQSRVGGLGCGCLAEVGSALPPHVMMVATPTALPSSCPLLMAPVMGPASILWCTMGPLRVSMPTAKAAITLPCSGSHLPPHPVMMKGRLSILQQLEPQAEAQGPVEAEARHQKSRMKRHLSQHRARCRMEDKLPIPAVPFSYACSSGQAGGAFCQRVVEAKHVVSTVLNFGVSSIY